jgi:hypothetical protein
MTTFNIDPEWVADQLDAAGYDGRSAEKQQIRTSVESLIREFNRQPHNASNKLKVLELFSKLAQQQELVGRNVQNPNARWREFNLGEVTPGSTVRVRDDAYSGDAGTRHNGMVGRLVAARGGDAIVQYHNSTDGAGHRHAPRSLEVLVKE